jgi:hypothetical protein
MESSNASPRSSYTASDSLTSEMPQSAAFQSFHRHVLGNPALLERLCAETDPEAFIRLFVELGLAHGNCMHPDEVRTALKINRREWLRWIIV